MLAGSRRPRSRSTERNIIGGKDHRGSEGAVVTLGRHTQAAGSRAPGRANRSRSGRYRWLGLLPLLLAFVAIGGSTPPASASTLFTITTNPSLVPAFATTTYDYAVRCAGHNTALSSTGPGKVTIGGKTFNEPVSKNLNLRPNHAVYVDEGGHAYAIRCLPSDFPGYRAIVQGTPQAHGYLVGLAPTAGVKHLTYYVVAFDNHGVPVWWYDNPSSPINAAFYGTSGIGWWLGTNVTPGV